MEFFQILEDIKVLIEKGGPDPDEYDQITITCDYLMKKKMTLEEESALYEIIKPLLSLDSMVGFSFLKPYGYSGDFELIDRIYREYKYQGDDTHHKWDEYYHDLLAARAVRNRKEYLKKMLINLSPEIKKPLVLNLASGPCTDLYEYFITNPRTTIKFDCIDLDQNAIDFGSSVCDNYIDSINYMNLNAFRYSTAKRYDLIWSAGLFDYFSDKLFIRLVNRMYILLSDGGELVVGNFSTNNPSRGVMEVMLKWYLHHRSEAELFELALKAGVPKNKIRVDSEKTGVNLFLHMRK